MTGESKWRYAEPVSYGEADFDGGENNDPLKVSGGVRGLLMNISNLKVEYKDEKIMTLFLMTHLTLQSTSLMLRRIRYFSYRLSGLKKAIKPAALNSS